MNTAILSRRKFLKQSSAIVATFSLAGPAAIAQQPARPALPGGLNNNRMLDGWIRINANGTVTAKPASANSVRAF